MKKRISFIAVLTFLTIGIRSEAKVPKRMLVEHFTNSYCSVCANRNPGFFNNLNSQNQYTLLTIYPSSPYPACQINKAAKRDNDGRTRFYGVYGSTPRLVLNGTVIPVSANYNNSSLFSPYNSDSSSFEIRLVQKKYSNGSIRLRVTIIRESADTQKTGFLYIGLLEDSLNFDAPNGEKLHRNVLRKALTDSNGRQITLPLNIGDSSVYYFESSTANLNAGRLKSVALLQDNNKYLIQSAISERNDSDNSLGFIQEGLYQDIRLFPNPGNGKLNIFNANSEAFELKIQDINGRLIETGVLKSGSNEISIQEKGVYILYFRKDNESFSLKYIY